MRKRVFLAGIFVLLAICLLAGCKNQSEREACLHTFGDWTVLKEPTCTEQGLRTHSCTLCGEERMELLSETPHTEVIDAAVAATCTEAGLTEGKHCAVCQTVLTVPTPIPPLGHTVETDAAVAATCTEAGLTEGKWCSVCSTVLVAQRQIPATGHIEVLEIEIAPTCLDEGWSRGSHCAVCEIPLNGAGKIPASGHTEVRVAGVAPTCTETGITDGCYCAVCEAVILPQTVLLPLDHTYVAVPAVEATCSAEGLTAGAYCGVCSKVLVEQSPIPAVGHTEVITPAVRATCHSTGLSEGVHCSVCSKVLVEQTVLPAAHVEQVLYGNAPTCTRSGLSDGVVCYLCHTVLAEQAVLPAIGHTGEILSGIAPTCLETGLSEGERCLTCGVVLQAQEILEATGHTPTVWEGVAPTATERGCTDGSYCLACGDVLEARRILLPTGYALPENYHGDYGYYALGKMEKGGSLQELYRLIDAAAAAFHSDTSRSLSAGETLKVLNFSTLGLTAYQAQTVWAIYRNDHPLYYWMANYISTTQTNLYLYVDEAYLSGDVRETYNRLIYTETERYLASLNGESSDYRIALAIHDLILSRIDYAYEADGKTPEDAAWAHNVLGVFEQGGGVCETYARAYQLFLNYCNVENVFVSGYAGEAHAWNLVRMDDGNWYWFDLTWNDTPEYNWEISYQYFCVNDLQNVAWRDGGEMGSMTFVEQHVAGSQESEILVYFLYDLPARSQTEFESEELLLRETFTVNGLTYAVSGYNRVQLVGIEGVGAVVIPETVTFGGVTYTVTSIGAMRTDGVFVNGSVDGGKSYVTSVFIPKSVRYVWSGALDILTLEEIVIDENNEYLSRVDV